MVVLIVVDANELYQEEHWNARTVALVNGGKVSPRASIRISFTNVGGRLSKASLGVNKTRTRDDDELLTRTFPPWSDILPVRPTGIGDKLFVVPPLSTLQRRFLYIHLRPGHHSFSFTYTRDQSTLKSRNHRHVWHIRL